MSMFRPKKLDLGCYVNIRVIRDHAKRLAFESFEAERQALRHVIRNTTLPARTRAEAQLQLTQLPAYSRPSQIRNRCILGGKTRGILRDFKLSRYNFRIQALSGGIPGVRKASLPEDSSFPEDLEKLGYYVNEDDEIRNIQDPRFYFKYFINRNMYYNDRQRFAFGCTCSSSFFFFRSFFCSDTWLRPAATNSLVYDRLAKLGLRPVRLPLGAAADEPHVTVLATDDLATAGRIVLFVGETVQDIGILARRIVGGAGGINKGSLVSMVEAVRKEQTEHRAPAILVFNPGQLFWWPQGGRALSLPARQGMPRPSAAHYPPRTLPGINSVPGHATADEHVASVFRDLLAPLLPPPRLTVIAIAGGADALEGFLDQADNWRRWGPHMDSLALLGGLYEATDVKTNGFRQFLRKRARAYIPSTAPVDMPISGPDGNDQTMRSTRFGCPVHSSGTSWLTELMFIDAQDAILAWGRAVADNPGYENAQMEITYAEEAMAEVENTWVGYEGGVDQTAAADDVEKTADKLSVEDSSTDGSSVHV
ncbi:mitochondrial 40S ribosomal protein mrp2 [Grosmannia clavigera kw1407]|uniref:Mitochondrial 40S ribosomal protein mrp2 n=1 Tax=Grosmannia clavigera (strain kw1407 / UAMH 11150) TaxID=655863 RepID=F0XJ56_GROCL|nr:mitochondrial 40S ribosomal protein mrp2 [Grosmannia clavigera kw1407]EFX02025.1 mitochondrial 40S ribosomal protein mrp2 [Grosmannia clavigera kw1407]